MNEVPNPEQEFMGERLRHYFAVAKDVIAPVYLDELTAQKCRVALRMNEVWGNERGDIMPTAYYDSRDRLVHMRVEPRLYLNLLKM